MPLRLLQRLAACSTRSQGQPRIDRTRSEGDPEVDASGQRFFPAEVLWCVKESESEHAGGMPGGAEQVRKICNVLGCNVSAFGCCTKYPASCVACP